MLVHEEQLLPPAEQDTHTLLVLSSAYPELHVVHVPVTRSHSAHCVGHPVHDTDPDELV